MKYYYSEKNLRKINKEFKLIILKNVKTIKIDDILNENDIFQKFNKNNESFHKKTEKYEKNEIKIQKKSGKNIKQKVKDINYNNNNNIKEKIKLNKNIKKKKNNQYIENKIKDFQLLNEITKDSYSDYTLDNTFVVFTSIDDIIYVIYTNKNKSIISYNIIENIRINEIKNAHTTDITNFRHFLDKINKRDILISISLCDNNLKLWDIGNYECICNLQNINKSGQLFSSCLFNDNDKICIITSCANGNNESIKVFDTNYNKIKEIKDSIDNTYFIDVYYDKKSSKNFIITGNNGYIKSYDYNENIVYHIYNDNDKKRHCSIIIDNKEDIIKMIESSFDGNIRIWDFHSAILLNKIKVSENGWLFGICLWDNEHLFVACGDKTIKIINIKKNLILSKLNEFKNKVLSIQKLKHPHFGECFISQGYEKEQIKMFINK